MPRPQFATERTTAVTQNTVQRTARYRREKNEAPAVAEDPLRPQPVHEGCVWCGVWWGGCADDPEGVPYGRWRGSQERDGVEGESADVGEYIL